MKEFWSALANIASHKQVVSIFLAVGLLLVALVDPQQVRGDTLTEVCDLGFSNGLVLNAVPIARTEEQQSRGLMERDGAGNGMLFSWPEADLRGFWMRNTRIPLSIAFIDAAGTLFAIQDMHPGTDDYHLSGRPAKEALELTQGEFERRGLHVGTRLIQRSCRTLDNGASAIEYSH